MRRARGELVYGRPLSVSKAGCPLPPRGQQDFPVLLIHLAAHRLAEDALNWSCAPRKCSFFWSGIGMPTLKGWLLLWLGSRLPLHIDGASPPPYSKMRLATIAFGRPGGTGSY